MKGGEWYLKRRRSGRRAALILSPIAASLVIIVGLFAILNTSVQSTVYIDINPSIEIRANAFDKVVEVKADNSDGEAVLDGMELQGCDLKVAANAILGSTVKHGYLSPEKNVILLSVTSSDEEKTERLKESLSTELNGALTERFGSGTVLEQDVASGDKELETFAEKHHISIGKAYLIRQITSLYPNLDGEKLASLSLRDIINRLRKNNVSVREFVSFLGDDPDDVIEDINEVYYGGGIDEDDEDELDEDDDDDYDDYDD